MGYLESIKIELKEWTEKKIRSNPKILGSDNGNTAIIKDYLVDVHKGTMVENLSEEAIKAVVSVSRWRNKLLENNPQFDFRIKNKPKAKR